MTTMEIKKILVSNGIHGCHVRQGTGSLSGGIQIMMVNTITDNPFVMRNRIRDILGGKTKQRIYVS